MDQYAGLTAETRIRHIALALFAENGYDATSVRAIANAAGVSPGLVIHHFGSKEGLRDAVNDEVARAILQVADAYLERDEPADVMFEAGGSDLWTLLAERPELGAYLRRLFFDGDEAGVQILQRFLQLGRQYAAAFEERGVIRSAPDPELRDLQGLILDFCPVLFAPLFAAYFGVSPTDEAFYRRWVAAEFDLFAHGMFTRASPAAERALPERGQLQEGTDR